MVNTTDAPPELKNFAVYARPRPTSFLVLSIIFEVLFWVLLPLFIVAVVVEIIERSGLILLTLWFPVLFGLIVLVGRFRKRFRVNARSVLENERRPPILYLRSFYYESADKQRRDPFEEDISIYERENDDEVLALVLRDVGPLVAVGKPNTTIPPLGSVRLYFKNEEWQEQVKKLIAISQLVIIQPGTSEGTEWEMRMVNSLAPPEKVIYSFLAWQHLSGKARRFEYEIFAQQIKRIYGCDLPKDRGGSYFLYFDSEQRPHLVGLPFWKMLFFLICSRPSLIWRLYTTKSVPVPFSAVTRFLRRLPVPGMFRKYSVPGVREALRPVLRKRGVRLPVWRTALFMAAVPILIAALVLVVSHYRNPLGEYKVWAYENGVAVMEGDLSVVELPFNGTCEFKLLRLKKNPACFSTSAISDQALSCLVYGGEVKFPWGTHLHIRFAEKTSGPKGGQSLFDGLFSTEKLFHVGEYSPYGEQDCLIGEAGASRSLYIRRKLPWE